MSRASIKLEVKVTQSGKRLNIMRQKLISYLKKSQSEVSLC